MAYVWLNDRQIEIDGQVSERQISPWTSKISSGGAVDFGSFAPHDIKEYADCRGGIGIERESADSDRLWWSEGIETTKERYLTLGALVISGGNLTTPPLAIIDFNSYTHFFGASVSQYWTGTTLAEADASPLATYTDVITMKDSTASYLICCNGSIVRYCSVSFGTNPAKNWATLSTDGVSFLTVFDKRLFGINSTGTTVFYNSQNDADSSAGSAMSHFHISGRWTTAYDLFEGRLPNSDESVIYMLTDVGLVYIDFWTRSAELMDIRYSPTTLGLKGLSWNGDIYVSNNAEIKKIGNNLVSQYGPDADDGLPSTYGGYIYDMVGTSHWLIITVSGDTYSSLLKRHESLGGWHQICSSTSNIRCAYHSALTSPGKLWFGEGNNVKYVQFPDKTHDVTKVSGYTYTSTGTITFPKMARLSVVPKIALQADILTTDCSANVNVVIKYRTDNNTDYTTLGTFNSSGHPTALSFNSSYGTSFNEIQMQAVLARDDTNTNSPKVRSLALRYVANPPAVLSWSFNLKARGDEAKEIITWLETARDSNVLINFSPVGDKNQTDRLYYVKIEQLPSKQSYDLQAPEKIYAVVVTEPI